MSSLVKESKFGDKLFDTPYRRKIERALPTLFNMVELENRRGRKLGMEVGTARERVLIALFMYVYGRESISFPPTTTPEWDVLIDDHPVSIKTKSGRGYSGVKLVWTVDWSAVDTFVETYCPKSDILFVNINWDGEGTFSLIPLSVQQRVQRQLGREQYVKLPRRGTNPRGVELSKEALSKLLHDPLTKSIAIAWQRDKTLMGEYALYMRWIELWDSL